MRPVRVAGNLRFLPRRQLCVRIPQQLTRLAFEASDLGVDVDIGAVRRFPQLGDARFELGDGLFEVVLGLHSRGRLGGS